MAGCRFIAAEKGGVARAKGVGEKEHECTTECKSRRRQNEKAPWALNYGSGREEVMKRGEERRREECEACVMCAAHGDRAAAGVDVDAQGSGLREDGTHFPLNTRAECRALYRKESWLVCSGIESRVIGVCVQSHQCHLHAKSQPGNEKPSQRPCKLTNQNAI